MRGHDGRTEAGIAFGYGWVTDGVDEYAFLKKCLGNGSGAGLITNRDWDDGGTTLYRETVCLQGFTEDPGIFMQAGNVGTVCLQEF